jgi:hypothetical protein
MDPMRRSLKLSWFARLGAFVLSGWIGLAHCGGGGAISVSRDAGLHESGSGSGSGAFGGTSGGGGTSSGAGSSGASDVDGSEGDDASPGDAALPDGAVLADGAIGDGGPTGTVGEAAAPTSSCQPPQGGSPCDPGLVGCGGSSCTTSSQYCCVAGGGDGGPGGTCLAYNNSSCPNGALTLGCDETSDCASGVCCEQSVALGVAGSTQCMSSCPSGWFQICKSNTECGGGSSGGGNCIRQTCTQPPTLLTSGSSVVVEACAVRASLTNLNNSGALAGCVAQ